MGCCFSSSANHGEDPELNENMHTNSRHRNGMAILNWYRCACVATVALLCFTVIIFQRPSSDRIDGTLEESSDVETSSSSITYTTVPPARMRKLEEWKEPDEDSYYTYEDVKDLIERVSMGEIKDPSGLKKALYSFPKKNRDAFLSETMPFIVKAAKKFN
eukprot:19287_1